MLVSTRAYIRGGLIFGILINVRDGMLIFDSIHMKIKRTLNTYWTKPRPTSKIIMLSSAMVGDAAGGAHHCRRKHNNFDVGRG